MMNKAQPFSVEQFQKEGYSGPIQGLSIEEAEKGYQRFFEVLGQSPDSPGSTNVPLSAWHHQYRWAYDLATHHSIVDPMTKILGDNVVLWAMHFWYKEPGNDKYIPWHQDINYWPMEPEINATAWVSLGHSIKENGCLRIVPGTHTRKTEHVNITDEHSAFTQGIPSEKVDASKIIDMEMTPGQITFFNEATYHGSEKNTSDIPRVAFSVRYTTPEVKFKMDEFGGNKDRIKTFLVHGSDTHHLNDDIIGTVPIK